MIVGDISLRALPRVFPGSTLAEAGRALRDVASGVVAVIEDDRLFGTVSERDLAVRACAGDFDPDNTAVTEVCDTNPVVCAVDSDLKHALRLMREHRQTWLVLVDRAMAPVGVLSLSELLDLLAQLLPDQSTGPEPEYVHRVRGDTQP